MSSQAHGQAFSKFYFDSIGIRADGLAVGQNGKAILLSLSPNQASNITKVDETGQVLWSKTASTTGFFRASSAVLLTDESCIVVAGKASGASQSGATIIRFDANGDTIWTKTFHINGMLVDHSKLISTSDSCLFVYFYGALFPEIGNVLKIDILGNLIWSRSFYGPSGKTILNSATELIDGSFIISGYLEPVVPPGGFYKPIICKFDSLGNLLWSKFYSLNGFFENVFTHSNEIRIVTRSTNNSIIPDGIIFSKLDENGINYSNFIDTNYNTGFGFDLENLSSHQQVNDSTYHVNFRNDQVNSLSLSVNENGTFFNHEKINNYTTGGSFYFENGNFYSFGSVGSSITSQLRFYHSTELNTTCNLDTFSFESFPTGNFGNSNLNLTVIDTLIEIPSNLSIENHTLYSYSACESQLNLFENVSYEFKFFPNPISTSFTIETTYPSEFKIELIDFTGRIVANVKGNSGKKIMISNLESGQYIYKLTASDGLILKNGKVIID
jgi:hypothetical protein